MSLTGTGCVFFSGRH